MIVMTDAHLRIIKHPVLAGTSQDMTQPVIEAEALDCPSIANNATSWFLVTIFTFKNFMSIRLLHHTFHTRTLIPGR
jgi:hypothetical protein